MGTRAQRRSRRRWRALSLGLGAALLGFVLASPLWFPWLLRSAGRSFGLDFGTFERVGYWRLRLAKVWLRQPGLELQAESLTVLQPLGWLVDRFLPGTVVAPGSARVEAGGWRLIAGKGPPRRPSKANSTAGVLDQVVEIGGPLQSWLRVAHLAQGQIHAGEIIVHLPEVVWDGDGRFRATVHREPWPRNAVLECRLAPGASLEVSAEHETAALALTLKREGSGAWGAVGGVRAAGNQFEVEGRFGVDGWLPQTAHVTAARLQWPTNLLALPAWLEAPGGRLAVTWATNRFTIDAALASGLALSGLPLEGLTARLSATGDLERIVVRAVDLETEAVRLDLAAPITVAVADLPKVPEVAWRLRSDLKFLDEPRVAGVVTGGLRLVSSTNPLPNLHLESIARGVTVSGQVLDPLEVRAALAWPLLDLERLEVGQGEARFTARARADLAHQQWVSGGWHLVNLPPAFADRLKVASAKIEGEWGGPLLRPRHSGTATWTRLDLPGFHPVDLELRWQGEALATADFRARAMAQAGELSVGGTLRFHADPAPGARLELTRLALSREGAPLVRLAEPVSTTLTPVTAGPEKSRHLRVVLPALNLAGDTRRLALAADVTWPLAGGLRLGAQGFRGDDWRDFVVNAPAGLELTALDFTAGWTNGPVTFDANLALALEAASDRWIHLKAGVRSSGDDVRFDPVEVYRQGESVATLSGRVPVVIDPNDPAGMVRLRPHGILDARLSANETGPLWRELTAWSGLAADEGRLDFRVTGTPTAPHGRLDFRAVRLRSLNSWQGVELPALDRPQLGIDLEESGLLTATAEAELAGQRGTLRARLPLDLTAITNGTVRLGRSLLDPLEANLRLPSWELAALAERFPGYLGPHGTLDVTARVGPSLKVAGELSLVGAATRPIPSVGVLRQIQATVRADEAGLRLDQGRAELNGQPVRFSGFWEFQPPATNGEPALSFTLAGTNLALARRADVFLRGDVALQVAGSALTQATLTGDVKLRDSLLLRDLPSLVSGNLQEATSRPPFFSVRESPWAEWRVNVRVEGDRFLRVVTPVFRGQVSARLQLAGTLGEPIALGELTVPEGRITFPFGGLDVDRARVSLTRENPFLPQVDFQASGLNFGFDVQMELSGPATAPNVTFSSVPPLTSTQLLLMLTAGDIPSQTFNYSAQGRFQSIAVFFGKEVLGKLTGDPESDRLTLRSGERVSDRGQLTSTIEYRLSPRWSAFGMRNRFDDYLGGLKWRVYSK